MMLINKNSLSVEMKGIKIIKKNANKLRTRLIKEKQLCTSYKVHSDDEYVYMPLITEYDEKFINSLLDEFNVNVDDYEFKHAQYRPTNFLDFLDDKISEEEMEEIRKSFDVIGDIVILEIPPELEDKKKVIGEAALKFTKRRSVYYKKSKIQGVTRTRKLEFLAGVDDLETIHKEFGIRFKLNPSTVYFSPRLATERSRIVDEVKEGEVIIDFFAGIGSFPISIAHVKDAKIYGVDINSEAIKYMHDNIKLNKLVGEVIPIEGDINNVIDELPLADRIIMNLPGTAKDFLEIAINHLKCGGILNYYEFSSDYNSVIERVENLAGNRKTTVLDIRKVKSQSPGVWHFGLSIKIE
ncbi:class I SAM-dependent methyltransferase family protein [Methanosphaera sp. ISO3-F5]|uniref:class I SAM-dependent methyltransferase n=1 Tax=Methanosphaera sp. ISO3-F5 TaxID=1452353 RepID=UPI003012B12A